jgi:hypothetical protein
MAHVIFGVLRLVFDTAALRRMAGRQVAPVGIDGVLLVLPGKQLSA